MKSFYIISLFFLISIELKSQTLVTEIQNNYPKKIKTICSTIPGCDSRSKSLTSRWYNYGETMSLVTGNTNIRTWVGCLFPDSSLRYYFDYGGGYDNTWLHKIADVFDPSAFFFNDSFYSGELHLSKNDYYMLDSIQIWGVYRRGHKSLSATDTLLIEIALKNYPGGYSYFGPSSNVSINLGTDTTKFISIPYNQITNSFGVIPHYDFKIPLTSSIANDTTQYGINIIKVPINLFVSSNQLPYVSLSFVPGYTWTPNDSISAYNNYMFLSRDEGDDNFPVYTPGDWNVSYILQKNVRYNYAGSWNGRYVPSFAFMGGTTNTYGYIHHAIYYKCSVTPTNAGSIAGPTEVCQGEDSVLYSIPVIQNATSYIWTLPSGASGSSNSNSILVNFGLNATSGNITVKGHNDYGDGAISTKAITVNSPVGYTNAISGDSIICFGQNEVTYTVPIITNATSYIWTLPPGATGTSSTNSITVNYGYSATSGYITVKGHNSCNDGNVSSLYIEICCKHCPDSLISATSGSFTHGCNPQTYNNSSHCKWRIFPSGASAIYISFPEFDILPGDKVLIWQGADTTGILKGTFDNNNPPTGPITTTVPMLVELITNAADVADGFKANFWTDIDNAVEENKDIFTDIVIYPNPATNSINVELPQKAMIEIYHANGQCIKTYYADKEMATIDISGLSQGLYFIKVISENVNAVSKFVKN